jgi:hypothetical protein
MTRSGRIAVYAIPFGVFAIVPVLCQVATLAPFGSPDIAALPDMLFGMAFVFALLFCLVSAPFLLFRRTRKAFGALPPIALMIIVGTFVGFGLGDAYRMHAFHRLGERSKPLIAAIQQYEAEHGSPPRDLSELVPQYLPRVPHTGMGGYPDYELVTDEWVEKETGNGWLLNVDTPSGLINWDVFLYYPNQQYPRRGYGGVLERVGDWAYVHE